MQPPKRKPLATKEDGLHAHRCPTCRARYEHLQCDDWSKDPECANCRYGTSWAIWRTTRLPQPCCLGGCRLVTAEEKRGHRLGGGSTWWICNRCKRTHPYEPKESSP